MNSPTLKCKCGQRPKFFCQTHTELICHREANRHPCLLIPYEIYLKRLTPADINQLMIANIINEQQTKIKASVSQALEQKAIEMRTLIKNIEETMSSSVKYFIQNWNNFLKKDLERFSEENGLAILRLARNSIRSQNKPARASTVFKGIVERHDQYQAEMNAIIQNDSLSKTLINYLKSIKMQTQAVDSSVSGFSQCDLRKQEFICQQMNQKIGQAILFEGKDLIINYFKGFEEEALNQFKAALAPRLSSINLPSDLKPRGRISRVSRLSYNFNNFISRMSFSENAPARSSSVIQPHRFSKAITEILGEIDFGEVDSEIIKNSQKDIFIPTSQNRKTTTTSPEDFDFEIDSYMRSNGDNEDIDRDLREKFEGHLQVLCQLLDKALYDFNTNGFFELEFRGFVNLYLDKFIELATRTVTSLKNTFNKLG